MKHSNTTIREDLFFRDGTGQGFRDVRATIKIFILRHKVHAARIESARRHNNVVNNFYLRCWFCCIAIGRNET